MDHWTSGYFAESGYTYGYYAEASPGRLAWAALLRGVATPTEKFSYLDLGCGQGFGLCALAAMYPDSSFVGVDFMPEHVAHARRLAQDSALTNIEFIEADFLELQHDTQYLEGFDYACAHGIATWVSPDVRAALVKTASRWLRPGGLFYCSYNTWPGWLATQPFQHMVLLQQSRQATGQAALTAAIDLFTELQTAGAQVFQHYPGLAKRLQGMPERDVSYQLQEYNNQAWQPAHVSDMFAQMGQEKLSFLGSATLSELFDELLPKPLTAILQAQPDAATRETVRDLAVNQSFRRDIYIKGTTPLWSETQKKNIDNTAFVLIEDPRHKGTEAFNLKLSTATVSVNPGLYGRVIDKLLDGPQPLSALRTAAAPAYFQDASRDAQTLSMSLLFDANLVAVHRNAKPASALRFNQVVAEQVSMRAPYRHLVMPEAGTAVSMTEFEMIAVAMESEAPSQNLTTDVVAHLQRCGRVLVLNGQEVSDANLMAPAVEQLLAPYNHRKRKMLCELGGMGLTNGLAGL